MKRSRIIVLAFASIIYVAIGAGCTALQNYQSHVAAREFGAQGTYEQSSGNAGGKVFERVEYRP